jgi:hypothetical protein
VWISAFTWPAERAYAPAVLFLAEFYLPEDSVLTEVAQRMVAGAAETAASGAGVSLVDLIFVAADETCFALFTASSPVEVAEAGSLAGLTFDRVVTAEAARL